MTPPTQNKDEIGRMKKIIDKSKPFEREITDEELTKLILFGNKCFEAGQKSALDIYNQGVENKGNTSPMPLPKSKESLEVGCGEDLPSPDKSSSLSQDATKPKGEVINPPKAYKIVKINYDYNDNISEEKNVSIWINELFKEIFRLLDKENNVSGMSGKIQDWRFDIRKNGLSISERLQQERVSGYTDGIKIGKSAQLKEDLEKIEDFEISTHKKKFKEQGFTFDFIDGLRECCKELQQSLKDNHSPTLPEDSKVETNRVSESNVSIPSSSGDAKDTSNLCATCGKKLEEHFGRFIPYCSDDSFDNDTFEPREVWDKEFRPVSKSDKCSNFVEETGSICGEVFNENGDRAYCIEHRMKKSKLSEAGK